MRPSLTVVLLSITLVGIAGGRDQELREEENTLNQWSEKLQHKDVEVRRSAAKALMEMGPGAKEAVPVLIKALQDKDDLVRANAAWALGTVGPEAEQAIPNLIEAFQDEVMIVRMGAAGGLGGIGPRAKQSIPALAKAIQNPIEDHNVHRVASEALGRMGPEAIPVLAKALQSENYFVRRMSARALEETGAGAVPALIKALKDEDRSVRLMAVQALGGIGPEAKQSVPALTKALQDERYNVRTSATRALWLIRVGTGETRKTGTFPHGKVQDGLAAFLLCHKNRFEVGEPIPLSHGIILVGPRLEPTEETHKLQAKVWRPFPAVDPDNMSWFEVTGPDGASVPYKGSYVTWATPSPTPSNTAILHHGEFLGRTHSDLCEQGTFHLSKPGQYKVRWGYAPWGKEGPWVGRLISNEVQFEIVADSAADEAGARETEHAGEA